MADSQSSREDPPPLPSEILLVEDNFIIALDASTMLQDLGVAYVATASNVAEALALISERPPQFVFLDVILGDEDSFGIAEQLQLLGIPFAFATGYGYANDFPEAFAQTPIVAKPYLSANLYAALRLNRKSET